MSQPPSDPGRSPPWDDIGCAVLAGVPLAFVASLLIALGGLDVSVNRDLGTIVAYFAGSFVVGAVFGFLRPDLSWRSGLVVGWIFVALLAVIVWVWITCTQPSCALTPGDFGGLAVILGCPVALCAGAALGSARRRAT